MKKGALLRATFIVVWGTMLLASCGPSQGNLEATVQVKAAAAAATVTAILEPTVTPTATPDGTAELCDWFVQTQFIRTERLGAIVEFAEFYEEHGFVVRAVPHKPAGAVRR